LYRHFPEDHEHQVKMRTCIKLLHSEEAGAYLYYLVHHHWPTKNLLFPQGRFVYFCHFKPLPQNDRIKLTISFEVPVFETFKLMPMGGARVLSEAFQRCPLIQHVGFPDVGSRPYDRKSWTVKFIYIRRLFFGKVSNA
jgi:hypothetical protein